MVVASYIKLPINEIITLEAIGMEMNLDNAKQETAPRYQPFMAIREATREEWIESNLELYGHTGHPELFYGNYYYEVSTD